MPNVTALNEVLMYAVLVTLEEMGEKVTTGGDVVDVHLNFAFVPDCR